MARKREEQKPLIIVGEESALQERPVSAPRPARIPITFDAWWLLTQQKHRLRPELKEAMKRHFEAKGFMLNENFEEGLRDFGIKS